MKSRKHAIEKFCRKCIHDPISGIGTWRQQTENCPSFECPLYEFRPLSIKAPRGGQNALKTPKNIEKTAILNICKGG